GPSSRGSSTSGPWEAGTSTTGPAHSIGAISCGPRTGPRVGGWCPSTTTCPAVWRRPRTSLRRTALQGPQEREQRLAVGSRQIVEPAPREIRLDGVTADGVLDRRRRAVVQQWTAQPEPPQRRRP